MICQCCGKTKSDKPIKLDVQPYYFVKGDSGIDDTWRTAFVCEQCYDEQEPDMWISRQCWEAFNPVVLFTDLEKYEFRVP
jgi:hypothetical protein